MLKLMAAAVAAVGVVTISVPLALVVSGSGRLDAGQCQGGAVVAAVPPAPAAARGSWSAEQLSLARTAVAVGKAHGIPEKGWIIAATAGLLESGMRNLDYGDRDSVGPLQQRPSAGWGTVQQIRTPALAFAAFYGVAKHTNNRGVVDVYNWEGKPVAVVAQAVQVSRSAAYAKFEAQGRALIAQVAGTPAAPAADCQQPGKSRGGGPVPASFDRQGNPRTVEQAIAWYTRAMPHGVAGEPVTGACERYSSTLAWGYGGGYPTAIAHWNAPGPRAAGYSAPPRGALVFWRSGNPAGHVAMSIGNGQVISTDYDSRTHRYEAGTISAGPITDIDRWGPRLGWRAPDTGRRF